MVVEGDQNKVAAQNPLFIIPSLEYHDILSPAAHEQLRRGPHRRPGGADPGAEKEDPEDRAAAHVLREVLRQDGTSPTRSRSRSESGDLPGPFTLAVAITDPAPDPGKQDTQARRRR